MPILKKNKGRFNREEPSLDEKKELLKAILDQVIDLVPAELNALAAKAKWKVLDAGEIYLNAGALSRHSAFVLSGMLKTVWFDSDGSDRTIELLEKGSFVTNFESYIKKEVSQVEIRALAPIELLSFTNDALMDLCKQSTNLMNLSVLLSQQMITRRSEHTHIISLKKPIQRYKYIIDNRPNLLREVSISELAKYLHLTLETVSRCRLVIAPSMPVTREL